MNDGPTDLYRAFDADGNLLYVGISNDWASRWSSGHRKTAPFFEQVAKLTMEHFETRCEASSAEITAIKTEKPLFNVAHAVDVERPVAPKRKNKPTVRFEREEKYDPDLADEWRHVTTKLFTRLLAAAIDPSVEDEDVWRMIRNVGGWCGHVVPGFDTPGDPDRILGRRGSLI